MFKWNDRMVYGVVVIGGCGPEGFGLGKPDLEASGSLPLAGHGWRGLCGFQLVDMDYPELFFVALSCKFQAVSCEL
jgi:hypothetical protein